VLAVHIIAAEGTDAEDLRRRVNASLHELFGIEHSTLQLETYPCAEGGCDNAASHDDHDHDRNADPPH
jgi:cobalt-zinc-cadmium efflux system protein